MCTSGVYWLLECFCLFSGGDVSSKIKNRLHMAVMGDGGGRGAGDSGSLDYWRERDGG